MGVNVHFVDIFKGLQFRRMFAEEIAMGRGDNIFCFHVRIEPSKTKSPCSDPSRKLINFEFAHELHLLSVEHTDALDVMNQTCASLPGSSQYGDDETVYTLYVSSFICAEVGTHGVVWCTLSP